MSYTKNSYAFDRMMEEQRERDDLSYDQYADELYHNRKKGVGVPAEDGGRVSAPNPSLRSGISAPPLTQEKNPRT